MESNISLRRKKNKSTPLTQQFLREVMDIAGLAEYLGMGKSKIYDLIRQKKIPASRIGRQYRFSRTIIDQWLREKLITQKPGLETPLFSQLEMHENSSPR